MCSEDCLRCLKGIQDIATKMTDQSRLALILILLPFVDVFSKRFKKIICTYNKKSELSSVGSFVDSEYATVKDPEVFIHSMRLFSDEKQVLQTTLDPRVVCAGNGRCTCCSETMEW